MVTQTRGVNSTSIQQIDDAGVKEEVMFDLDARSVTNGDGELVNQSWSTPIPITISIYLKC